MSATLTRVLVTRVFYRPLVTGIKYSLLTVSACVRVQADSDPSTPLYPWQLFSLLGFANIHAIIHAFYSRVYADTGPSESRLCPAAPCRPLHYSTHASAPMLDGLLLFLSCMPACSPSSPPLPLLLPLSSTHQWSPLLTHELCTTTPRPLFT